VDRVLAFACKVATAEECALLHPLMEVSRRRGRKRLRSSSFVSAQTARPSCLRSRCAAAR
jgi:hypothetical protein